jgi:hypothetical protein
MLALYKDDEQAVRDTLEILLQAFADLNEKCRQDRREETGLVGPKNYFRRREVRTQNLRKLGAGRDRY